MKYPYIISSYYSPRQMETCSWLVKHNLTQLSVSTIVLRVAVQRVHSILLIKIFNLLWCYDEECYDEERNVCSVKEKILSVHCSQFNLNYFEMLTMKSSRVQRKIGKLCYLGCFVHLGFLTYNWLCPSVTKVEMRLVLKHLRYNK